jgi:hypothetical protein
MAIAARVNPAATRPIHGRVVRAQTAEGCADGPASADTFQLVSIRANLTAASRAGAVWN